MQEQLPSLHAVNEDFLSKFNAAHPRKVVFQQATRGAQYPALDLIICIPETY